MKDSSTGDAILFSRFWCLGHSIACWISSLLHGGCDGLAVCIS